MADLPPLRIETREAKVNIISDECEKYFPCVTKTCHTHFDKFNSENVNLLSPTEMTFKILFSLVCQSYFMNKQSSITTSLVWLPNKVAVKWGDLCL